MAGEVKDKIVLVNKTGRQFHVRSGRLMPGGSLAVTPEEAKQLLEYPGVMDASKIVKEAGVSTDALTKENAKLKKSVDGLSKDLEESLAANDKLKEQVEGLKGDVKELKEKSK